MKVNATDWTSSAHQNPASTLISIILFICPISDSIPQMNTPKNGYDFVD